MSRPEHKAPPEIVSKKLDFIEREIKFLFITQFYNEDEARKYTNK